MQTARQTTFKITPSIKRAIVQIVDERLKEVQVTREDFSELKSIVGELAEGQKALAQAQKRTEERVEELAQAQKRTEESVAALIVVQEKGFQKLNEQIASLGSRWGIYNEGTFRSTIRGLLARMQGVEVRTGEYGGRQVDVIIRDGEHVLLEITSRMHFGDIERLYRSAEDYQAREGVAPALMVATSYVSPRLMEKIMGLERPIEIFSYEGEE